MRSMLVIGAGHFGSSLAIRLTEVGNEVLVVDIDETAVNKIAAYVTQARIGDCMDIDNLRSLGIRNFDVCFVCISDNFQSSMEITSLLKELGAAYIVAKADREIHAGLLKKIGANDVVFPERDMANRTAMRYSTLGAFDYIELSDEYVIMEIVVPPQWVGRCIRDLDVRSHHEVNVIGIRDGKRIKPLTSADYIFKSDERLVVAGEHKNIVHMMKK